ncbi:MAG: thiol reductase thioredoxin [Gammaproteobacteria bacterium]|nr:thiol reductase thioredoxin [Gammaproteobacteria bacterium]MEE2693719.1 thioredoxin TrxA [Pseudomonadota bacterium]|tara:strand:+ start:451 stop:777 length:327 start_codon:yes stop_codon:yes gene_type:complete
MSDTIVKLTDSEFENQVIKSEKPILVDYWAEWCGPCKMIAPILEEVSTEMSDKIIIGKLNVDENSQTPPKYGIRGIPTLMIFKDGNAVGTHVGALSKSDLIQFIENNI